MKFGDKVKVFLNPNGAFKVYMYHKDRRITEHIVFPKNAKFTLKGNGYIINPERIFIQNKMPCSAYSTAIAEPVNPLDINQQSELSSTDFYNAIEATVVQDIIRGAGGKSENSTMIAIVVVGVIIILALVFGIYYLSDLIGAMETVTSNAPPVSGTPVTGW